MENEELIHKRMNDTEHLEYIKKQLTKYIKTK